jgi:hypothetical protein
MASHPRTQLYSFFSFTFALVASEKYAAFDLTYSVEPFFVVSEKV